MNIKIGILLNIIMFGIIFSTSSLYSQMYEENSATIADSGEVFTLLHRGPLISQVPTSTSQSETDIPEILFVDKRDKASANFINNITQSGILLMGLGLVTAITTVTVGHFTLETESDCYKGTEICYDIIKSVNPMLYELSNVYGILYLSSTILSSIGASALSLGITYKGGTVEEYQQWKKETTILGTIFSSLGAGILGTSIFLSTLSLPESIDGALLGSTTAMLGTSLLLFGLPNLLVGIFGIL